MRGVNVLLSLIVTCLFVSSTYAQAPIKKPEKRQQTTTTTTTTQQKPRTNMSTSFKSNDGVTATSYINGHGYVDLGLSVKWATCNVGASSPSDYGNYYAWGETRTKSSYTEENSKTYGKSVGSIAGNPAYDAARANWGGSWRLPTRSEIGELGNKCTWKWTTQGGHNGYKITGPNGNSIFVPAAGWRDGTSLIYAGEYGSYWSATPYEDNTGDACGLLFGISNLYRDWHCRTYAQSVRPVSE